MSFFSKIAPHTLKLARVCALKTINRLLAVAHHKHRAIIALTVKKLLRQRLNDCPLVRRRVLRLVNQNIVDTAVQFKQHPVGNLLIFQQVARQHNQVVIVHFGILLFIALITANQLLREQNNGFGRGKHL